MAHTNNKYLLLKRTTVQAASHSSRQSPSSLLASRRQFWQVSKHACQPISQSVSQSVNQSISKSVNLSVSQPPSVPFSVPLSVFYCPQNIRKIFWSFSFYVRYSALLRLPPLRFYCVEGCWKSNPGLLQLWH